MNLSLGLLFNLFRVNSFSYSALFFLELFRLKKILKNKNYQLLWKKTSDLPWNILKENRNNWDWKYEDWESFNEIFERTWKILKLFWTYNDWINILVFSHWSIIRSIIIYIIFNWKISPWEYFRLTEILKIKSCWISEIIYSKEKFEKIYTWKIKDFMNSNNIIY